LGRSIALRSVELIAVILLVSAVYPGVGAAYGISTTASTGQVGSLAVVSSSTMQYPSYYCSTWDSSCSSYYGYNSYYPYYSYYYYPYSSYYSYYPYNSYYPYYYQPAAPQPKTFQLNVNTNPSGIGTVNGKGTYNDGSSASFSVTSLIVPSSADQRYVFSSWSGDFSGTSPSGSITMDSAKTVVANYRLQNYLKVSVDPQGITYATGEGWYSATDSVTVGPVPTSIPGGEGVRYIFQQWTIDNGPISGNSAQVTMDAPHTVVAHYKTQYQLTVTSDYGIVQGAGWYDAGSSATFSVTTQVDTSYGVKQVFESWTGDAQTVSPTATITMDSPHSVTAIWRTDSTILYATIALGIAAAFVLGIGLTMFAFMRSRGPKPASAPPPTPVTTAGPVHEETKPTPTRKKTKAPPKVEHSESSSETKTE